MARAHAIAALVLLAGCAMLERAPERVVVMAAVTQFSSGQPGRPLPSGWRAWTERREEVRNIYEDYKRAFGEEPPMTRSVGVMTDTDNTGEKVHAYYGDISFACGTALAPFQTSYTCSCRRAARKQQRRERLFRA